MLHRRPFDKPELAAGGNCSGLDKLQLAWPEAALPWCAAGHGRSVFAAACLAVSRYLATAGLFDGTQLHGTPARRDIPRRPSNQTFVAVPKLKRNTSRRPPSALFISLGIYRTANQMPWTMQLRLMVRICDLFARRDTAHTTASLSLIICRRAPVSPVSVFTADHRTKPELPESQCFPDTSSCSRASCGQTRGKCSSVQLGTHGVHVGFYRRFL